MSSKTLLQVFLSSMPYLPLCPFISCADNFFFFAEMKTPTKKYLLFVFLHLAASIFGSSAAADPYNATDLIALSCGAATTTNPYVRPTWTGDLDPKFSPLDQGNKSTPSTALKQKPSVSQVPYTSARLSYSEFTYSFPVTSGPKFIRLHFYPASYPNFDRANGFFSVSVGNSYTLLKNFSAALSADADEVDTFFKEFIVNVEADQRLNITFTPTLSNYYAFINGIEVVSMPPYLYYSDPQHQGVKFIGQQILQIESNRAMEMVYRINVGGENVEPPADTGMFRTWVKDVDYLTDARPSALPYNWNRSLKFSVISNYSAPGEVYNTARTMGPNNNTVNNGYNLTWEFPVHSAFTYLVRLHFCEFEKEVTKPSDRMFQIFIANQTAEDMADVIVWTGGNGNGIPIYKDYAVLMGKEGTEKKRNLSVKLHPAPEWRTLHSDAILNGVEIFKLSNTGDLSGPNPDPSPITPSPPVTTPTGKSNSKSNHTTIIATTGGVVSGLLVASLIGFLVFWRGKGVKGKGSASGDKTSSWAPFSYSTTRTTKTGSSALPSDLCHHFSLSEIKAATNNFDKVLIIGVGGFGNVYKGYINDGATPVAIKRLNPESQQGANEFMTEIEMLSQLRYLHLVSLIGYCNDDHEMILVYDYMTHGTLRDHLYNSDNPPLSWKQRLDICIGAARGLHYLHSGAKHTIIHRDVKTTNILLDENWVAKVSDFGLSKMGPTGFSKAHVSTVVKGSFGYVDPEYYRRQQLTEKSDVYSFGVVLFEVLCARPPLIRTAEKRQVSLAEWARQCYQKGKLDQIIDQNLRGKIAPVCLKKFGEIAVSCLLDDGIKRPAMNDVVWGLEFALQLQKSAEEGIELDGGGADTVGDEEEVALVAATARIEDSDDVFSSSGGNVSSWRSSGVTLTSSDGENRLMSGTVFSELMEPKGR